MKFIANVLIALLAIYGAYKLYEAYAPPEWPHWVSEAVDTQPSPTNLPAATRPVKDTVQPVLTNPPPAPRPEETRRIVCPTCDGEGQLTYADSRGANHVYACPICNRSGLRVLHLRAGQYVCPDCKGMGVTERREARKGFGGQKSFTRNGVGGNHNGNGTDEYYVRSSRCLRCLLSGVIDSPKVPPPGVTPGVQVPETFRH